MDELAINSRSYLLWNNTQGFILAEKDASTQTPVASLTKIMTTLITLEHCQLDEVVEITPEMLQGLEEFAVIGLLAGQKLTVRELIYATMLPSAGDAAQALAIHTAGSIEAFADLMNQKATEIGMINTHFSNAVGFDEENYSTPQDILTLLKTALQNETFVDFFETFEANLPSVDRTVVKTFRPQQYIKGGKTGFTNAAGRCLASTAEIEGEEYILVTIGAAEGENVRDANKIYDFVAEKYEPTQILTAGETLVEIPVAASSTKAIEFQAETDIVLVLEDGIGLDELDYSYEGVREITRVLDAGDQLGTYRIKQDGRELYTQEIYYTEQLEFYHYEYVAAGGVWVAIVLILTILAMLKRKWKLALGGAVALIISLAVGFWLFHGWFETGAELKVYQPQSAEDVTQEVDSDITAEPTVDLWAGLGLASNNCTTGFGNLMLINPNFTVDSIFIQERSQQLISVSQTYGIQEYHPQGNGDNLMIPEAAEHLSEMLQAYAAANPGHEMGTYSCFRARGTSCGRLCAATGASDHHTGLTCDLIDLQYGSVLDTDDYEEHIEWQWLKENSYKYGFIDRFPEDWAGGSMLDPLNVDEYGSTGLFETWHYRYVGVAAATEIALGKYNNGEYDSLEHYLKAVGVLSDLKNGVCTE